MNTCNSTKLFLCFYKKIWETVNSLNQWITMIVICHVVQYMIVYREAMKRTIISDSVWPDVSVRVIILVQKLSPGSSTSVVGAVGKISAFQPQGPRFEFPALQRFKYLCDLLFCLSQLSFPSFRGRLMSTSICWELTCDGLVSHPEGVKDSHLLTTTETGDRHRLHGPPGS